MKHILITAICILPLASIAQKNYTIHGQVADTSNSGKAYLRYLSNSRQTTDSALIVKGKFTLSAPVTSITTANLSITHIDGKPDVKSVYIEPQVIRIISATPFINDALISGSPVNDANAMLTKQTKPLEEKADQLNKEWMKKTEQERADTALFNVFNARSNALQLEFNALRKKFALEHSNSYMGLVAYAISRAIDLKENLAVTERDFNRFSPEVRASDIGKTIAGMIEGARGTKGGLLAMENTQKRYTLQGSLADPETATQVFLIYHTKEGYKSDSAAVINGKFSLSAPLSSITSGNLYLKKGDKIVDQRSIYLEPREIRILSATSLLKDASITGSPVNDENQVLQQLLQPVIEKNAALMKKWKNTPEKDRDSTFRKDFMAQQVSNELESRSIKKQFALSRFNSYVGFMAYMESGSMDFNNDFEGFVRDFNKFSPEVRATDLGTNMKEKIDGALKTKVGLAAMDFTQNDVNGRPVKLSDFRGKFVLLDFWASWCGPCRAENPTLVKAFNNYKDKKFTILSVSLDKKTDKAAWLKAIETDGMVWNHVSDLNYWRNEAAVKYGIQTVPTNFLIDPSGKIIARDLRGEALEGKLAELMQ